jgi:hypothetical protein
MSGQPESAGLGVAGELRDVIRKGEGLCSSPRAARSAASAHGGWELRQPEVSRPWRQYG